MGSSNVLGTGEEDDVEVPVLIASKQVKDLKVVRVSAGGQHTIILGQPPVTNHNATNNTDKQ